jgi:hypothetical protein
MAIKKQAGRQEPALAVVSFTIGTGGDITAAGTYPAIELPQDAVVQEGWLNVKTATSAGVTIAISDGTSTYLSATTAAATGLTELVPTGKTLTQQTNVNVVVVGSPTTLGTVELVVEYFQQGKTEWTQG